MQSAKSNLIFLILIFVILPGGFAVWSFTAVFDSSARGFVEKSTQNILKQSSEQIATLVRSAEEVVELQNDVLKTRAITLDSAVEEGDAREFLKANVANLGILKNVGLVDTKTKHFMMSYRDKNDRLATREVKSGDMDMRWERYWQEEQILSGVNRDEASDWQRTEYRVEHRPWYRDALQQEARVDFELIWTAPYVFQQSGETGISCAKAINKPGKGYRPPFAIAFADISLKGFSDILTSLDTGEGSFMMLLDRTDRVLASSLPTHDEYLAANKSLPGALEIASSVLNEESWQALKRSSGSSGPSALLSFQAGDGGYYARALPLAQEELQEFGWSLWVFVPKASLLDEFQAASQMVYLVTGISFVLALVLVFFVRSRG